MHLLLRSPKFMSSVFLYSYLFLFVFSVYVGDIIFTWPLLQLAMTKNASKFGDVLTNKEAQ